MYTVLICDDDADIVSALDIYLSGEGYRTIRTYNGQQALRAAEELANAIIALARGTV